MSVWTASQFVPATGAAPVRAGPPPGSVPALAISGVAKRYGRVVAVQDLSLWAGDGQLLTVVGPSGCGKSTTLRLVAGLERPDAGEIHVAGEPVAGARAWRPPEHRRVGLVFQDHALFPHLTVAGNVAFGLDRWAAQRRQARVGDVLDLVRLSGLAGRYPHELSGGEQQRVALARALAPEPAVVLLDEPFSNLDRNLRNQIRDDTVTALRGTGTTGVLVTHDQAEALAFGDRLLIMRDGRIEQAGTPDAVFHRPVNRFVAEFMGEADFLPGRRDGDLFVTELGAVAARTDQGATALPAEVMVRPHEVTLHVPGPGDAGARVVAAEFQGAFVLYTVELASGRRLRSLQPHTSTHRVDSEVRVELTPGHRLTVLAADDAARSAAPGTSP